MLAADDLVALFTTFKLALISTLVLLALGTPLAWWLARSKARWRSLVEAIVALPLVLPPTVLGFYLLIAFNPNGAVGSALKSIFGQPLAFSFVGLVVGSVIYSLPFVVQPLQNAFIAIGNRHLEVAATLGASRADRFLSIVLPLAKPGYITAAVLGFAHTIGEFGVVLMIGGNIPGETRVASIAIYDHVESLHYTNAHVLSVTLIALSFVLLLVLFMQKKRTALI